MAAQAGLLVASHQDMLSSLAFSPLPPHQLASASLDAHIRVYSRAGPPGSSSAGLPSSGPSTSGSPFVETDVFRAHDGPVMRVAWGDGEWGALLASAGADGSVRIWDRVPPSGPNGRWIQRASLIEARGSVRDLAFAPSELGLRLAAIGADSGLRVYECPSPDEGYTAHGSGAVVTGGLASWTLLEEIVLTNLPLAPCSSSTLASAMSSDANTLVGGAMSGVQSASGISIGGGSASGRLPLGPSSSSASVAASTTGTASSVQPGRPLGPETDGGWAVSWCREAWWGPVLAVGAGSVGAVRIFVFSSPTHWSQPLVLQPPSPASTSPSKPTAVTSIDWAPGNGRSYQLVAAGFRDGMVRVWRVSPPEGAGSGWSAECIAELTDHVGNGAVGRVEFNVTGTVLSSAGDDGKVRLWKPAYTGEWRSAAVVSCEPSGKPNGSS